MVNTQITQVCSDPHNATEVTLARSKEALTFKERMCLPEGMGLDDEGDREQQMGQDCKNREVTERPVPGGSQPGLREASALAQGPSLLGPGPGRCLLDT